MNLSGATELLTTLGFVRNGEEFYILNDENVCTFVEGEPAVDYRRRLVNARQTSEADYKK